MPARKKTLKPTKSKMKLLKSVKVKGLKLNLYEVTPKGLGAGHITKARMKKLLAGRNPKRK